MRAAVLVCGSLLSCAIHGRRLQRTEVRHALPMEQVLLVASAPARMLDGTDVQKAIAEIQGRYGSDVVKMAFDWAGSSNAHPDDVPLFAQVQNASAQLAIPGSDREAVMEDIGKHLTETLWWQNYVGGIKATVKVSAQSAVQKVIHLGCIAGGPISQYEQYSMQQICKDAAQDIRILQEKGSVHNGTAVRVMNFFSLDEMTNFIRSIAPLRPDPKLLAEQALKAALVGEWNCTDSFYFGGHGYVTIYPNLQYTGHGKGTLFDGLVRIMDVKLWQVNLKRTVENSNDHIFLLSDDGLTMKGYCPQSGSYFTFRKVIKRAPALADPASIQWLRDALVGKWKTVSGNSYFGGDGLLTIHPDLHFSGHGHGTLNDGLVRLGDPETRHVNLRRTVFDANDHVFQVSEDGMEMRGSCWDSDAAWVLRKVFHETI